MARGGSLEAQRFLLRALLWLLAGAAAAGVLAVFISTSVMGRVAGSALIAAISCGLASPVSKLLDFDDRRRAGLVGLVAVVAGFVLGMGGIWVGVLVRGTDLEAQLALSAVIAVAGGLVCCTLLVHARKPAGRLAALAGVALVCAAAAAFAVATWWTPTRFGGEPQGKIAATGGNLLLCGVPCVLCLIGGGLRDRPWRWPGLAAGLAALAMALAGVWYYTGGNPAWLAGALTVSYVAGYANAVVRVALGEAGMWARLLAVGSAAALGLCITLIAHLTGFQASPPDPLEKATGAAGIVAVCSTIGLMILYRLNRRTPGVSENVAEIAAVQVACPHCGTKRAARVGESACDKCGLMLRIAVREPRCAACDYSLLDIPGGVCPECGGRAATEGAGEAEVVKR